MVSEWLVPYAEIVASFKLAMTGEAIDPAKIENVLATVEDFAVNNLGDD